MAQPPPASDQPVPMIQDDRCANDLQARGPFRNNGTLPLESTLENWGTSLNVAFDLSDALQLKSISAYRDIRWTGARDADNTPLTILHTIYDVQGDQFSQELQLTYQTEPLTGVVGAVLLRADVRRHRDGRAESAAAGRPARQRQQQSRQQELGGVHAVDLQLDREARAHRGRALHRGREGLVPRSVRLLERRP